jgi:hypothetical protein
VNCSQDRSPAPPQWTIAAAGHVEVKQLRGRCAALQDAAGDLSARGDPRRASRQARPLSGCGERTGASVHRSGRTRNGTRRPRRSRRATMRRWSRSPARRAAGSSTGRPCALRRPQRPTGCRHHAIPSTDLLSLPGAGTEPVAEGATTRARILPSVKPDIIASDARCILKEAKRRRRRSTSRRIEEAFHAAKEGVGLPAGIAQPV